MKMNVNWTPWCGVSFQRRLEVLSIGFFMYCGFFGGLFSTSLLLYVLIAGNIYMKTIALVYIAFYLYDRDCGDRGGRGAGNAWVRGWPVWKYCIKYFPIDLVKTVDFTADRNYLICIFPHGISSIGAAANFGTSHSKWSSLFPEIRPKLTTLHLNTQVPLTRELILNCGIGSATSNSLTTLLKQTNDKNAIENNDGYTANGVGLVLGGVREVFYTYPNTYRCVLAKRRGFIRIALQTGASLVPALSFGENDVYEIMDLQSGYFSRFLGYLCKRYSNIGPILFCGRGFFQYNFGLIQRRHPVTTVIGAPIHLDIIENPDEQQLNKIHDLFCTQLTELFESHKHKYVDNPDNVHLEIV